MTRHRNILNFIAVVRDSRQDNIEYFINGGCFKFHLILRAIYKDARPYTDGNHVVTKIGKYYYDITGVVYSKKFIPFPDLDNKKKCVSELM